MFSSGLSFKKITFSRCVAYLGGEIQEYVLPKLTKCNIATSFDVWMFQGAYDNFPLVINILEANWQPKHFIIGFFETTKVINQVLTRNLIKLLNKYGWTKRFLFIVKDDGSNLNVTTPTLNSIVSCECLGLEENFQGSCWLGFFKIFQYATTNEKMCKKFMCVSIEFIQLDLQKYITWL